MQLKPGQKTTLKTHMGLNTNLATRSDGAQFVINTRLATRDPDDEQAIADWYNGIALAGDNQPFVTLFMWNPVTTEDLLAKAIDWTTPPPHGLGGSPTVDQQQLAINNQWWRWDKMLGRRGYIDMTDPQTRGGVIQVWGNIGPVNGTTTASAIGTEVVANLCGKLQGRRVELALNSNAVGGKTAWNPAVVCPLGLAGATILGQTLTQPDVDDILLNG